MTRRDPLYFQRFTHSCKSRPEIRCDSGILLSGAVYVEPCSPHETFYSLLHYPLSLPRRAAGSLVYVENGFQFGTVDLASGAFTPIGPGTPEGVTGLAAGPNGSLLTLSFSGNLESINPTNGAVTIVGATGLGDCSLLSSPCGPTSANTIAALGGKFMQPITKTSFIRLTR